MLGFYRKNKSQFRTFDRSGFSLMEMVIVTSIFVVITMIVLANAPEFREKTSLELVAQEVALNIRSAQVYGLGTRKITADDGGSVDSFGIYIDSEQDPVEFILFADKTRDEFYSGDSEDCSYECLEKYEMSGIFVKSMEVYNTSNGWQSVQSTQVLFTRPSSEAMIFSQSMEHSELSIILESSRGSQKEIKVFKNGQIAISDIN